MAKSLRLLLLIGAVLAQPATAHLSWVRLPGGPMKTGELAQISLDHGDMFPVSEGSLPLDHVKAQVMDPDGVRQVLPLQESTVALVSSFMPSKPGLHVLSYIYDPGVMSKTEDGWHIGGADQYPVAIDRLRGIQTAVNYSFAGCDPTAKHEPLGLPIELVPRVDGEVLLLTLLKDGVPYPGAEILFLPWGDEARAVGITDQSGRITFTPPRGFTKEVTFGVKIKLPMPEGSGFDRDVFFTTLCLDFR